MRIESCRKCGDELKIKETCPICKEVKKFICKNCHYETDEQIHSICRLVDMNHRPVIYEAA